MKRLKVVHINSTAKGGGVSEILSSLVRKAGHDWKVISSPKWYFCYTKAMHNFIQGKRKVNCPIAELRILKQLHKKGFREMLRGIGESNKHLLEGYDIVVLHDPQTLPLAEFKQEGQKIIWRCHIDFQRELPSIYNKAWEKIDVVVAHRKFPKLKHKNLWVIKGGINPASEKNRSLPKKEYQRLLGEMEISHLKRRFKIVEVSRFDPWKGQDILIKSFLSLKLKNAVLILAGNFAYDDPEAKIYAGLIKKLASKSKNIIFLENYSDKHINALQRFADVIVQPSIREGYGLIVSEALFKGKPVIASDIPAFRDQIKEDINGFLFRDIKSLKGLLKKFHNNPELLKKLSISRKVRTIDDLNQEWQRLVKEASRL